MKLMKKYEIKQFRNQSFMFRKKRSRKVKFVMRTIIFVTKTSLSLSTISSSQQTSFTILINSMIIISSFENSFISTPILITFSIISMNFSLRRSERLRRWFFYYFLFRFSLLLLTSFTIQYYDLYDLMI